MKKLTKLWVKILRLFSKKKKARKTILFDESAHYHDKPLSNRITWSVPTGESFDASKINMCRLDEFCQWKEVTPEEVEQAKIAYEKWKSDNQEPDGVHRY